MWQLSQKHIVHNLRKDLNKVLLKKFLIKKKGNSIKLTKSDKN